MKVKKKTNLLWWSVCYALNTLALLAPFGVARGASTAFTYQGHLSDRGNPANGSYDLRLVLYDASVGGSQAGQIQTNSATPVNNGLFTIPLDFGDNVFNGKDYWLELGVRTNGNLNDFIILSPRQALTPTPYALSARNLAGGSVAVNSNGFLGIGTATPQAPLHIQGDAPAIEITDTNSSPSGALRGNDGTWLIGFTGIPGAEDISVGANVGLGSSRTLTLSAGDFPRVKILANGNVGIRTLTPSTALEVNGDVRQGPDGKFFTTAGEENLRIVRGFVQSDGKIVAGSGFSVKHSATGYYQITFTLPFSAPPTVVSTVYPEAPLADLAVATTTPYQNPPSDTAIIQTWYGYVPPGGDGQVLATSRDENFSFIAVGPK